MRIGCVQLAVAVAMVVAGCASTSAPAEIAKAYLAASATTIRNAVANTFRPFHPGAVRYCREQGMALRDELSR